MFASKGHTLLAVIGLLLIVFTSIALAHEGATGVVKERMNLMKDQQKQMKLIGEMLKGKTRFDAAKAGTAAKELGTTTKKIPELFPEGISGSPRLPAKASPFAAGIGSAMALPTSSCENKATR
jgi:cytochrome c556